MTTWFCRYKKNIKLVIYTLYLCTFHNSQWTSNDSLVRYSYKAQWIYRTKCMESLISCVNSICSLINYWSFDVRTLALSCTEIFIHSITMIMNSLSTFNYMFDRWDFWYLDRLQKYNYMYMWLHVWKKTH